MKKGFKGFVESAVLAQLEKKVGRSLCSALSEAGYEDYGKAVHDGEWLASCLREELAVIACQLLAEWQARQDELLDEEAVLADLEG